MIEKTTILFFIPVWKRLKITEACYKGLKRIISVAPGHYQFETLIVYSEPEHAELATRYGFRSFYAENEPLGKKFNVGMEYALNNLKFDYIFQLNSDNVFDNGIWALYNQHFHDRIDFFGIDKIYAYHPATGRLKFFMYYDGCGAGRVIRRDIVEKSGWHIFIEHLRSAAGDNFITQAGKREYIPKFRFKEKFHKLIDKKQVFRLWDDKKMRSLDTNSANRIFNSTASKYPMRIPRHEKPVVLDIKSEVNIWKYDELDKISGEEIMGQEKTLVLSRFKEATDLIMIN